MASRSRRFVYAAISVGLFLLTVVALAFAGARVAEAESHARPSGQALNLPPDRLSASDKMVVAVVLGSSGTVGSDAMAPYEVFASSPKFSVYTIAAQAAPAAVKGVRR